MTVSAEGWSDLENIRARHQALRRAIADPAESGLLSRVRQQQADSARRARHAVLAYRSSRARQRD